MELDLSTPAAQALDISVAQLGTYLIIAGFFAPLISAARPYVEPALRRWRESALLTATSADDIAVAVFARVWSVLVLLPILVLKAFPIFQAAIEAARAQRPPKPQAPKGPSGTLFGLLTWALLLTGVLVTLMGCGPTQAQALHRGLNRATDYVDPVYELAVVSCDLAEGELIARHQPDEGAAYRVALERVRLECDRIFASFEELRALQLVARAAADALNDGRATAQDLIRSLDDVMMAAAATRELVTAFRARNLAGAS